MDFEAFLPPVVLDLAGGARGSIVSSKISGMSDRLRFFVRAVDVREEGLDDEVRLFVDIEVLTKKGHPGLRFRCSSLLNF